MTGPLPPDTAPIRADERFEGERLARYLRARLPGAHGTLTAAQFPGGHSNLTYLLRFGEHEWVLRRPPLGPVPATAHDMHREFRVLSGLADVFPPAPRPLLWCDDPGIIGAPFFVMERRRGIVIRDDWPPDLGEDPALRRRISAATVDTLAALHAIDASAIGLGGLGRPEGFVERQIHGWAARWERAKTREVPALERLREWLLPRVPPPQRATIIHNDFKLDNIMLDLADPGRVEAVMDWEMCTRGDPLVDLGLLLAYWPQADDAPDRSSITPGPTRLPGFFTREEVIQRYVKRTAFDTSRIAFYQVLALYKLTVVIEQIYARFRRGQTRDERFAAFADRTPAIAAIGLDLAERSGL